MDNIRVNGDTVLETAPVIVNSASNFIIGDWDQVAALYRRLDGTLVQLGAYDYYHCEFRSRPVLGFHRQPAVLRLSACDSF
jgi:hypothetical protein